MEPLKRFTSVSYSWTQPYTVVTPYTFTRTDSVQAEIERLEQIDRWVSCMHTYPDALVLLEKFYVK